LIELSGKLSEADVNDMAVLLRSRWYWLSFIAETWHGAALLVAIVWGTALGLMGRTSPNWLAIALVWIVIAGIFIRTAYTVRRERKQDVDQLNAKLPEKVRLTSDGITWVTPSGGRVLLRWSELGGWRERRRVVAIHDPRGAPAVVLSIADLPELERQRVRDFLCSQIPPPRSFDPPSAAQGTRMPQDDRRNQLGR
jgi:hypothetical protein